MLHYKNSTKNKESFNKNHGLLKEFKMQLKRKTGSLKSTLNVVIVINLNQSKKSYYNNYFRNNNNTKNTWKGIKSIISLNTKESESSKIILNNKGEFLTNPNDISNQFNNFFVLLHLLSSLI